MADKLMYVLNEDKQITPLDYNQGLKRLVTQLNESTNLNLVKVPKVVKPTNNKTLLKNFEPVQ